MSIGSFLSKSKHSLVQSIQSKGKQPAHFVIGNESADLDSIICALVYGYIQSSTPQARQANRYVIPITNIPSGELRLRSELQAVLQHANVTPSDLITLDDLADVDQIPPQETEWTLVDHNAFHGDLGKRYSHRTTGVIDHHTDEGMVPKDGEPRVIAKTGSCCSHVVEYCKDAWDKLSASESAPEQDSQLAKLALGPILIDTVNLLAKDKTTDYDKNAIAYLESKISTDYDRDSFFKEIHDAKSDLDDLSVEEILRKDYKEWKEGDLAVGISSMVRSISYLKSRSKDLVPELANYAKSREVQLYAVMTAHNDTDQFERELLLMALDDGESAKIAEKFAENNKERFQLKEDKELHASTGGWFKLWTQKDLTSSRKQVAPAIRDAMKRTAKM